MSLLTLMTLLCGSIFGLFVLRNLLLCGGNLWKSATFSVAPGFWGSFARLDFLVAAHKGLLLSSRNTDPPCTMASFIRYCPKLQKSFYYKRKYLTDTQLNFHTVRRKVWQIFQLITNIFLIHLSILVLYKSTSKYKLEVLSFKLGHV